MGNYNSSFNSITRPPQQISHPRADPSSWPLMDSHQHVSDLTSPVLYREKKPVPYVLLASPRLKHCWPTRAACWSPRHWWCTHKQTRREAIEQQSHTPMCTTLKRVNWVCEHTAKQWHTKDTTRTYPTDWHIFQKTFFLKRKRRRQKGTRKEEWLTTSCEQVTWAGWLPGATHNVTIDFRGALDCGKDRHVDAKESVTHAHTNLFTLVAHPSHLLEK